MLSAYPQPMPEAGLRPNASLQVTGPGAPGSLKDSPCTGLTLARGPGLQRPVSPAAGGGEEGGESAGPALRRAARTTAKETERADRGGTCARATPPQGHAHWPGCPLVGGAIKGAGSSQRQASASLHVDVRGGPGFPSASLLLLPSPAPSRMPLGPN